MSNLLPIPSIASARAAARNRIIAAAAALLLIAVIPPLCIAAVAYVALPSDAGAVAPAARQEATDLAALDQSQRLMSQLTPMLVPERAPHNAVIPVLNLPVFALVLNSPLPGFPRLKGWPRSPRKRHRVRVSVFHTLF
jgi:hypothetical protein